MIFKVLEIIVLVDSVVESKTVILRESKTVAHWWVFIVCWVRGRWNRTFVGTSSGPQVGKGWKPLT